jgi:hypothetical protein
VDDFQYDGQTTANTGLTVAPSGVIFGSGYGDGYALVIGSADGGNTWSAPLSCSWPFSVSDFALVDVSRFKHQQTTMKTMPPIAPTLFTVAVLTNRAYADGWTATVSSPQPLKSTDPFPRFPSPVLWPGKNPFCS